MQPIAFDVDDDFVVEADLVQVAAAVIQVVDLSAVGQDGGGTVAVEVVVVADGFSNGQVQHVVLRIAPVSFGQSVSGVLFLSRYFPLVLADDLAVAVVVEAGDAVAVGGTDEVAVLVGIITAAPNQWQDAFKGKVGLICQKLQTMYRIDRTAGTYRTLAGQTGFRGESFAELAVHMEHIAGTHDIAFADFNRGRMAHRPGGVGGGTALYPFTARKGDFIAISCIRLTGFKDKSRLAVEAYVFGDGFGTAEVGKKREGNEWNGRGSGRRRPTEIGDGKDNAELAAFTGDFIDGHGGLLLLGMGSSEREGDDLTGR